MTLLLQRVVVADRADDADAVGANLEALARSGRRDEFPFGFDRAAGTQRCDVARVVRERRLGDDLDTGHARAVRDFEERNILAVPRGAQPALHDDPTTGRLAREQLGDADGAQRVSSAGFTMPEGGAANRFASSRMAVATSAGGAAV